MPRIECFQQLCARAPQGAAEVRGRERLDGFKHGRRGIISAKFSNAGRHQAVSFPETYAFAPDQCIGEFGNGQKIRGGALGHTGRIHFASAHDTGEERQCAHGVRSGAEYERLQIVLSVVDVAERCIV